MDVLAELKTKRADIMRIAQQHGVVRLRIFGSVARGEAGDESDIDLLVAAGPHRSFFFPGGLIADLEDLLGRRLDIATERGLEPELREQALREAIDL